MSAPERLQKLLARTGDWSRRQAEDLIRAGRVTVNGQTAELGQQADPETDAIKVDARRVHVTKSAAGLCVLLNKPSGRISTRSDPEGRPTIVDLLPARLRGRVRPVGRLDFETEGLILLTDDGDLAQRVAHPRYGCAKTYEVKVKGKPDKASLDRLREGIKLYGKPTSPAKIVRARVRGARDLESNTWWTVVINEGRTRQIREMFFRIGHPVKRLRRIAIGPLRDPHLRLGAWRILEDDELAKLWASLAPTSDAGPAAAARKPKAKRPASPKPSSAGATKRASAAKTKAAGKGKGAPPPRGGPKGKAPAKGRAPSKGRGAKRPPSGGKGRGRRG